jgi:hypothetical protein
MVSPVSTAAFVTCLAVQWSGPSALALDAAYGDSSATASIAHIFFILVKIYIDVTCLRPKLFAAALLKRAKGET